MRLVGLVLEGPGIIRNHQKVLMKVAVKVK